MVSSLNAGPTAKHVSASKIVIMVQSLVILSLSFWITEEYLNNIYLRDYVTGVFQTEGWLFGILGLLFVVGSISGMMLVRRRHVEKTVGEASLKAPSSVPRIKGAAEVTPKPAESTTKSETDFHPVVAALKADMANRRLSFGSAVSSTNDQPATPPAPRPEVQKTAVLDQFSQNRQTPISSPAPQQIRAPFPQRPMLPLRPQESSGSSVLQPVQPQTPQMPANISTVITGIMPVQKKKDPAATTEDGKTSQ